MPRAITSTPKKRSTDSSIRSWRRGESTGGHGGDLPNIYAASDGTARADFFTAGITLDSGPRHSVFDDDGSAIIVHEKPDAYGEEESETGNRVACGVIRRYARTALVLSDLPTSSSQLILMSLRAFSVFVSLSHWVSDGKSAAS